MFGTGEYLILNSLFCGKNHVFGHRKRDIERKLESRGCFSRANIFALLKLKKWNGYRCIPKYLWNNFTVSIFQFCFTLFWKKLHIFPQIFNFYGVMELLFKFHFIYSMAENYVWCIIRCRYYSDCTKYIVPHSKYDRFILYNVTKVESTSFA